MQCIVHLKFYSINESDYISGTWRFMHTMLNSLIVCDLTINTVCYSVALIRDLAILAIMKFNTYKIPRTDPMFMFTKKPHILQMWLISQFPLLTD